MENPGVRRFEGKAAVKELKRHLRIRVGQRPKISIESRNVLGETFVTENIIVRNLVPLDPKKPAKRSIFHAANPCGQPTRIRFVWPRKHADPQGKNLYPLMAIEVPAP
jgi:hypothetical protein